MLTKEIDMNKLEKARKIIDEVDREMARLFLRRMEAARLAAEYKKENALPVYDGAREDALIAKNSEFISDADPEIRECYVQFLRKTMEVSRHYQSRLIEGMKIAYSGTEGAFAHIAAEKIFPSAEKIGYADFPEAYEAVERGECDAVVLPIENSSAGEVGTVADLLYSGTLYINGTYDLAIVQDLLTLPGADPREIKTVVSHPQALHQCEEYIRAHGYDTLEFANTALAAERVRALGDPTVAAIASEQAGKKYGLTVAARAINASSNNTTRFAILSAARNRYFGARGMDMRFILMFTVKNEAGSLAQAIDIIGKHGFNMQSLRSRPDKRLLWQYYFYVEAEGNIDSDEGEKMLAELGSCCEKLKLIGSYRHRD
ncbi:MAG: bifunctional chorismate mutase/prephenate dehydratase [Ruminococcaceae bacterium]|nr:bifunctional chorismate mutase/prephenate dehydratase [Oscillospiraceae bacterium]